MQLLEQARAIDVHLEFAAVDVAVELAGLADLMTEFMDIVSFHQTKRGRSDDGDAGGRSHLKLAAKLCQPDLRKSNGD
jgi:hypothetical protein